MLKIGITMGVSNTQYMINQAYVNYVREAGYQPILITPCELDRMNLGFSLEYYGDNIAEDIEIPFDIAYYKTMAEMCDGLLLPGGIDVDPIYYGEHNYASHGTKPEQDDFERKVFYSFKELNKPVMGICRGCQFIIREFLDSEDNSKMYNDDLWYWQHINGHSLARDREVKRSTPTHYVNIKRGLYNQEHRYGDIEDYIAVNSMHHQALVWDIKKAKKNSKKDRANKQFRIGKRFEALALTRFGIDKKDKTTFVIEAFRIDVWQGGKIMGVQWHPEELKDYALINNFFEYNINGVNADNAEDDDVEHVEGDVLDEHVANDAEEAADNEAEVVVKNQEVVVSVEPKPVKQKKQDTAKEK